MQVPDIMDVTGLSISEMDRITRGKSRPKQTNYELVNKILYENDMPVALDVLVDNERERFKQYCAIESKAIGIMHRILDFYSQVPPGDIHTDSFISRTANDFLKATHAVRAELLEKYKIDKQAENDNTIKIEFISATDKK